MKHQLEPVGEVECYCVAHSNEAEGMQVPQCEEYHDVVEEYFAIADG